MCPCKCIAVRSLFKVDPIHGRDRDHSRHRLPSRSPQRLPTFPGPTPRRALGGTSPTPPPLAPLVPAGVLVLLWARTALPLAAVALWTRVWTALSTASVPTISKVMVDVFVSLWLVGLACMSCRSIRLNEERAICPRRFVALAVDSHSGLRFVCQYSITAHSFATSRS